MIKFLFIALITLVLSIKSVFSSANTFISAPVNGSTSNAGSNVMVTLSKSGGIWMISQTCGSSSISQTDSKTTFTFELPPTYVGQCLYTGYRTNGQQQILTPVYINVVGTVAITTFPTTVLAGSTVAITLSFTPTSPTYSGSITLTCPSGLTSSQSVSTSFYNFPVPSNFYENCEFSTIFTNYDSVNTVDIFVTQNLVISNPTESSVIVKNENIYVLLTPGNANVYTSILTELNCPSSSSTPNQFNVITLQNYVYNYPSSFYGQCALSVVSSSLPNYLNAPTTDVTVYLKYPVSIAVPTIVYIGQNFDVTVTSNLGPSVTTTTLQMYCDSVLAQTYTNVPIGSQTSLDALSSLTDGMSCYLAVPSSDPNIISSNSDNFQISDVQLQFSQPTNGITNFYPNSLFILVNSDQVSDLSQDSITLNLTCNDVTIASINVTTGVQTYYSPSSSAIGSCTLYVVSAPNYYVSPQPVNFCINGTLALSTFTSVAAGSSATISIYFSPVPSVYSGNLTLTCPGLTPFTHLIAGIVNVFPVPLSLYGDCVFSAIVPYYSSNNTQNILVTQTLEFISPVQDANVTIHDGIPILLQSNYTGISENIALSLSSGSTSQVFNVTTNNAIYYSDYPNSFYGPCLLNVDAAPSYFVLPQSVALNLKYYLTISAPSVIYIGQSFNVTISSNVSTVPTTVGLNLVCDSVIVQSWPSVTIGSQEILTANTALTNSTECTLQTAANDPDFNFDSSTAFPVSNIQLYWTQPTEANFVQPDLIPILVSSLDVPLLSSSLSVNFTCGSFNDTFTIQSNTLYDYAYSSEAYGSCTLSVGSSYNYILVPSPNPLPITIQYGLEFVDYPPVIFINDNFNVYINSSVIPATSASTAGLTLYCNGSLVQTWQNVILDANNTLTAASNLTPSNDCFFQTVTDPNFVQAISSDVKLSQIDLILISPISGLQVTINNSIPVLVETDPIVNFTDSIEMRLQCGTNVTDFNVTTWQAQEYFYSESFYGPCNISINSYPSYYKAVSGNSIVLFSLKYQLQIVSAPSLIYTGQEFNITIGTTYQPASVNQTNLELFCNETFIQSWTDLYLNTQLTLTVASELDPSTNCYFATAADTEYFFQASSVSVTIDAIQLSFISPSDSITVISQDSISTLVTANLFPLSQYNLTGQLYCDSPASKSFSLTTGVASDISYNSDFYGNCTMSIPSVPGYLIAPSPVSFSIKFNLTFVTVPSVVYFGYSFVIEIDSSVNLMPLAVSSVPLALICGGSIVDSWNSVAFNQPVNLPLTTVGLPSSDCQFVTTADNTNFINVSSENVTLSKATISISSPMPLDSIINPEPFDILLVVNEFPSKGVPVQVGLNCAGPGIEQDINVSSSVAYPYSYTIDTYGNCSLSILSTPTYYNVGSPVEFFIKYQLRFVDAPELVHIGSDFLIEIASTILPLPEAVNTTTLALYCGTPSPQQVWTFVPLNEPVTLHLINNTVPSGDCKFVTESNPTAFNNTEIIVSISNSQIIDLIFTLPIPGVNIVNPAAIETYISADEFPSLTVPATIQISCPLSPDSPYNFTLDTSTLTNVLGYPSSFYGPCAMSVVEAPVDFIFPAPVSFNLNYSLSFVNAPSVINSGIMFTLLIGSSALNPTLSTSVVLICDNSTVDSWQNVAVGISVTLLAAPSLASNPQCSFTTRSENPFLTPATPVYVIIDRPVSPFGGDIVELTPEKTQEFAQNLDFFGF